MALASGVVVATAIADLLPEAFELAGFDRVVEIGIAAVAGFIGFSFLEAFLHQSSFEHADEDHGPNLQSSSRRNGSGIIGLLPPTSLVIHSALDGLVIGLAFQAGDEIGLIVLLAVLLHDFADGMNVATVALEAARGERLAVGFVLLDAIAAPAGGALSTLVTVDRVTLGLLLAVFAGVFLAIGAGHLLPESQHRDPSRGPVMVSLAAAGAAVVLAVRAITPG
jgi:ZIP family zinc transporter